jgi:type-F conjugative transfer system pilin assembly protein TrbC
LEEEKLLRILKLLLTTIFIITAIAAYGLSNEQNSEIKAIEKIAISNSEKYMDYVIGMSDEMSKSSNKEVRNINEFLTIEKSKLDLAIFQGKPKTTSEILVFVSFSMPKSSLISILKQCQKHNAEIILRGLKENSLPMTVAEISNLIKESKVQAGFQIAPNLFDEYKIEKVPAIVKSNGDNFDVVYGLANIEDALYVFKSS